MSSTYAKTLLLIPDSHSRPGDPHTRFKKLHTYLSGRLNRPLDKVVHIGDLWDFESLCHHDSHLPEWNDRSLSMDIEAGADGLDHILSIAKTFDVPDKDIHFLAGNHEERYNKWMQSDNRLRTSPFPATMKGLVSYLRPKLNLKFHAFLKPAIIYGTVFQHYFTSGLMGRPQGGEHHANNLLRSQHTSCVCGHSHLLSTSTRTKGDGAKINALVAGAFIEPGDTFSYAGPAQKLWWSGAHLLHFYRPGEFDIESISIERLYS